MRRNIAGQISSLYKYTAHIFFHAVFEWYIKVNIIPEYVFVNTPLALHLIR